MRLVAALSHLVVVPDSWWVGPDPDGGRAIYAPPQGTDRYPRILASKWDTPSEVWDLLSSVLPDRGDCEECTATPCEMHGGAA